MKRTPFILVALALLMALSCSKSQTADGSAEESQAQTPVAFGAYLSRSVSTRAGYQGTMASDKLKSAAGGFGVFGFYTNDEPYSASATPDFMYNQQVYWNDTYHVWEYFPVKYWPNSFGENAQSSVIDRLSFFAYAPYVEVDITSGLVKDDGTEDYQNVGITALSRNTASGDPRVKYSVSMDPRHGVDLCWGVAASLFQSSVDGSGNDVPAGHPYINLVKPKINDRLHFNFYHALAALNVLIDTDVDVASHADGELDHEETRIYVRAVTFKGFSARGALNLNSKADASVAPLWTDINGRDKPDNTPVTVYDARRDGKEGADGAEAVNETPTGLNPVLVQSKPYFDAEGNFNASALTAGVTHTAVNLFDGDNDASPILVIPNGQALEVTVVYDVETIDPRLSGTLSDGKTHGSSIENRISRTVTISGDDLILVAGKKYTVTLHLGMTSVKASAVVADWDTGDSANTNVPGNVPSPSHPGAYFDGEDLPDAP